MKPSSDGSPSQGILNNPLGGGTEKNHSKEDGMKTYSIVAEAKNHIIIDEVKASSIEEAISKLKEKHKIIEFRTCVVSPIKGAA